MPATDEEARQFARAFTDLMNWVSDGRADGRTNPVVARVSGHLTASGLQQSVVSRQLPPFEQVNQQVALEAWMGMPGRTAVVEGLAMPPNYGTVELHQLLHGDGIPPLRLAAPDLVDLPSGPGRTTACFQSALVFVEDARGSYVIFSRGPVRHQEPNLTMQIAGLPTVQAQEVLQELAQLRTERNVYRAQVLELSSDGMSVSVGFPELTPTGRADVVLPEAVLHRVERHTLDVAQQRVALRAAGQHLKRGLLLYGPPGTGKTHTTRYIVQHLSGSTVLMLSGRSLHLIGSVTQLARELQPAVVVLEDVDLVAEDRGHGPGPSPVLFELLDAMDGAAADADLLFLLTTNRADLLEPALAARPGRVDVAIEIGLPDAAGRRRLLEVYSREIELAASEEDLVAVVDRSEGVTASFIKELVRRAVLEALRDGSGTLTAVSGAQLLRALEDLLDSTQGVTRALLGVPADQSGPPSNAAGMQQRGGHGGMSYAAVPGRAHYLR